MFINTFASRIKKNPRASASVYFFIIAVALSALLTTKRRSSSPRSQHGSFDELHQQHLPHHESVDFHHHQQRQQRMGDVLAEATPATTPASNSSAGAETAAEKTRTSAIILTVCMLVLSAICAGLTLGIMGLDTVTLEVIADAAPEPDRSNARKLLPIRHLGHQTLCTLIVTNMFANVVISTESGDLLPEHPDAGAGGDASSALIAFFLSTFLILIFAEILPMAICTGPNALKIAAASVPLVKVLLVIVYPIAKPLGWALDKMLHHDPGQIYDREELKKLFTIHSQSAISGLKTSELDLLLGAFDFGDKRVNDIMTPFETVIVLRSDAVLDAELLRLLWSTGHSRIPIVDANKLPQPRTATKQSDADNSNNNNEGGGGGGGGGNAFREDHASSWDGTKNNDQQQKHGGMHHNQSMDQLAARARQQQHKRRREAALTVQDLKIPADMLHHVHIVGILFVKDLLLVMDQNLTVAEVLEMFPHGDVFSVWHGAHLRNLLTSFQQGQCHMVIVRENKFQISGDDDGEEDFDQQQQQQDVPRINTPKGRRPSALGGGGAAAAADSGGAEQQQKHSPRDKPSSPTGSAPGGDGGDAADYENLCYVQPEDRAIGIITLEALIETLIRAPIWDEHDDEEEENKQKEQLMMSHFNPNEVEQHQKDQRDQQQQQQQQNGGGDASPSGGESAAATPNPMLNPAAAAAAALHAQNQTPASQHAASRTRHQLKSVHFFDFAVSKDDVRNMSEGTAVRAPPLTAPQCVAIARYLLNSVDSFSVFGDGAHLAKLLVGSDCYIINPRKPDESHLDHTSELVRNSAKLAHAPVVQQPVLQGAFGSSTAASASPAAAVAAVVKKPTVTVTGAVSASAAGHDEYDHHKKPGGGGHQRTASAGKKSSSGNTLAVPDQQTSSSLPPPPSHLQTHHQHHAPMTPAAAAAAASASFLEAITPDTTLYTRDQRSVYFTLVLGGSVRIVAGRERFHSDVHSMSWLGERALQSPEGFVPAFDAFALTPCRVLKISTRTFTAVRQVAMMSVAANTVTRSLASNPQRYAAAVGGRPSAAAAQSSSEESAGGKDDIELLRIGATK